MLPGTVTVSNTLAEFNSLYIDIVQNDQSTLSHSQRPADTGFLPSTSVFRCERLREAIFTAMCAAQNAMTSWWASPCRRRQHTQMCRFERRGRIHESQAFIIVDIKVDCSVH